MAVHDKDAQPAPNKGANTNQNQRQERAERPARETPAPAASGRVQGTMRDMNRLLGSPISRNTGGGALTHAIAAFKDWTSADKNVGGNGMIDLTKLVILGLDASEYGSQVSSAIFAYPYEIEGTLCVYAYTAALESSVDGELPPKVHEINRRPHTLPGVVGDYITEGYLKSAEEIVAKYFADARRQVQVIDAGWRVVSKNVDFALKDNPAVRQVAFYALAALNAIVSADVEPDLYFDLGWLQKGDNLDIAVDVSGRELLTADQLTRRSDLVINVSGNIATDDGPVRKKLAMVGGNINLVFSPDEQEQGLGRRNRDETQVYTPLFVINNMDTGLNAITPEILLLGLAGASVISRHNAWAQVFIPNDTARGQTDYRNTGYLGLLGPNGEVAPVGSSRTNLDLEEWGDYFFSLVRQDLAWGIEVEEGGDNSWITSLLLCAANGDRDSEARLWEYADRLTLGNFSARARELGVKNFVELSGAKYLTGTYLNERGEPSDLRDFDLLRWLVQTGNNDKNIALDWQETFDNVDLDWEVRVAAQMNLLNSIGLNMQVVRYVNLLYIDPAVIQALATAVDDCNIGIDQAQTQYQFGNRRIRGNLRIKNFAAGDVSGGIFNRTRNLDGNRNRRSPLGNGLGRRNF